MNFPLIQDSPLAKKELLYAILYKRNPDKSSQSLSNEYTAKWGVQMAGMNLQTRSSQLSIA